MLDVELWVLYMLGNRLNTETHNQTEHSHVKNQLSNQANILPD